MLDTSALQHIQIPHTPNPVIFPCDAQARLADIPHYPLTIIHAPAGYGKTTLLAHWCQSQTLPTVWISIAAAHQQPQVFLRHLYAAIQQNGLIADTTPVDSLPHLLEITQRIQRPWIIVIDALESIQSTLLWDTIETLYHQRLPSTRFVFTGRCMPQFSLSDDFLRGHVNHITKKTLTFSPHDSAHYLSHSTHHPATNHDIIQMSEGWALALRLFGYDNTVSPDTHMPNHLLGQFFQTIFTQLPATIQRGIGICMAFPRFNKHLIAAVAPEINASDFMAYLYQQQLFVEPLDTTGEWHRFHGLLATTMLASYGQPHQSVHIQGATWLAQQGYHNDALVVFQYYHRYDDILHIAKQQADTYLQHGDFDQFLASMALIPPEMLAQEPEVAVAYAWALIMRGEYEQCHHVLQLVTHQDIQASDEYRVVQTICMFYRTGMVDRTVFQQPEFMRLYTKFPFLHGLAALFTEDVDVPTPPNTIRQPVAQLYSSMRMLLRQSKYAQIHLHCQESLHNPPNHPLMAAIYGIWSEAAYALNLTSLADQLATQAHTLATTLGNHHIRLLSAALRAHTLRVTGQQTHADALWAATYHETLQQQMIPLGRVFILKELWRYAIINHQHADCHTIQHHLTANLHLIDIPTDVHTQLTILGAYTAWQHGADLPPDLVPLAEQALANHWHASFVAIVMLIKQTTTSLPHSLAVEFTRHNPRVHMPGLVRDWEQVLEYTTANNHPTTPLQQLLTPREYEVFVLAAHGLTNNEIAAKLCVSVSTVKTHLINIYAKLNIKRRTDVVHLATQYRIQP